MLGRGRERGGKRTEGGDAKTMQYTAFANLWRDALEQPDMDMYIAERGWQEWMDNYDGNTDRMVRDMRAICELARGGVQAIRAQTGLSRPKFCEKYAIPQRTLQNWEIGVAEPLVYLVMLLAYAVLFGE